MDKRPSLLCRGNIDEEIKFNISATRFFTAEITVGSKLAQCYKTFLRP
jgi:hypothetical protein